jgi:hypothetical protein
VLAAAIDYFARGTSRPARPTEPAVRGSGP